MIESKVVPAPGHILVLPDKRKTEIGGVQLAVQGGDYHEGEIIAVGHRGQYFRHLRLTPGHIAIYAKFNSVEVKEYDEHGLETVYKLVNMLHIVGTRDPEDPGRLARIRHAIAGWWTNSALRFGFVTGVIATSVYHYGRPIIDWVSSKIKRNDLRP